MKKPKYTTLKYSTPPELLEMVQILAEVAVDDYLAELNFEKESSINQDDSHTRPNRGVPLRVANG